MESNNFEPVGLTDRHTSHNAQSSQDRDSSTTSPSQAKEAHFSGMLMSLG